MQLACQYCIYSVVQKWFFRPAGATCCPDKREIWHGGVDHRTAACQISCLLGQKCGNTAPKMVTIWNFAHECAPQGRLICTVFMKFSEFVAFNFSLWSLLGDKQPCYKHFPSVGAFSHKFSTAPSGKTTDRIKKKLGVQKWHLPPLLRYRAKYGGDCRLCTGCRQKKCDVFLFVCHALELRSL